MNNIKEGYIKKGGKNEEPTCERPKNPPKGQNAQEDFTKSYTHTKPAPRNPRPKLPKGQDLPRGDKSLVEILNEETNNLNKIIVSLQNEIKELKKQKDVIAKGQGLDFYVNANWQLEKKVVKLDEENRKLQKKVKRTFFILKTVKLFKFFVLPKKYYKLLEKIERL